MKARGLVASYYLLSALVSGGIGFFMGTYSNFLRAGLNNDEFLVNLVNVAYFATITLCEIPTGLYADIFGRKKSFIVSCLLETMSFGIYAVSKNFAGFVLAETTGAIGKTFASGAFDAWIKDSLKQTGEKINLIKIFARSSLISRSSTVISAIVGGWLADKDMSWPFIASAISYAVCGFLAVFLMKENGFDGQKLKIREVWANTKQTWRRSVCYVRQDANYRLILWIGAIQTFAFMAPNMQWQRVFRDLGFNNSLNGLLGSLICLAIILGHIVSPYIVRPRWGERGAIFWSLILTGVCIALTVLSNKVWPVLIFFFLHEFGRGVYDPIMKAYTQDCITSDKERATLVSFGSMVSHLGGALGLITSGLLAKYFSLTPSWLLAGLALIVGIPLVLGRKAPKGDQTS